MPIPKEILTALALDELVIFVGSGFSMPLNFYDWNTLASKAIDEFVDDYPQVSDLKKCLANNAMDEVLVFDALLRINQEKIEKFIQEKNNIWFDSNKLTNHRLLWDISKKIVTTNFDKLLVTARPDPTIPTITNDSEYEIAKNLQGKKWLFHIHGEVDAIRKCVIFSKDYHRLYNEKHPSIEQLKSIFQNNTLLFIGFSMKDRYVSNLFKNLSIIFKSTLNTNHFILVRKGEKSLSSHLREYEIENYDVVSDLLMELKEAKHRPPPGEIKIARYLRRRCRSFEKGSDKFNELLCYLLQEPVLDDKKEAEKFTNQFESLDGYEKCMLNAVLFENQGRIEQMIDILKNAAFAGNQELSRLLYLAIGLEKMDFIKDALEYLDKIINTPQDNEIILSAKFNRNICYEKLEEYEKVRFEDYFLNETTLFFTNEKIKDKAISNHLIICHKTKKPFAYQKLLEEGLENSLSGSPKSYCKSLINYLTYKNEFISKEKYDEIFMLSKSMGVNNRVAMLCEIFKKLDNGTQKVIQEEVLIQLETLMAGSTSFANNKHIQNLKKYINDKKYN